MLAVGLGGREEGVVCSRWVSGKWIAGYARGGSQWGRYAGSGRTPLMAVLFISLVGDKNALRIRFRSMTPTQNHDPDVIKMNRTYP